MIEPSMLKQLGWSESLISEIVRAAENLQEINERITKIDLYESQNKIESSTAFYFDKYEINTKVDLPFSAYEKV